MNKGNVLGKAVFIFISLTLLTFMISSVLAGDVAYIYKKSYKIDQNMINEFSSLGLTTDLINENSIPSNISSYKILFVGDEIFRNANTIPIGKIPTIIANYYHGDLWGLADNEGVSQLGSNSPLQVNKNGQVKTVYTRATDLKGISIPYYYLDDVNKAPGFKKVAGTYTGSNGYDFGDVVSYANSGTRLLNGKLTSGKLCFFGIIESDFWTPEAKQLFDECIGFVSSQCESNSQCPANYTTSPYCQNGDVYQNLGSYMCLNPSKINAQCILNDSANLIQHCQFGCSQGACLPGKHDVSLVDLPNSVNKIRIEYQNGTIIPDDTLKCNENYIISVNVKNSGNFFENVTFIDSLGSLLFSHSQITNLSPNGTILNQKTINVSLSEGKYNLSVQAVIPSDINLSDNLAKRELQVLCPQINCSLNSQCGTNGFISSEYCSSNNVVKDYKSYTCNLPGTPQSFCSSSINTTTINQCSQSQQCSNGQCVNIACYNNSQCGDNNPLTLDECINPGTVSSQCRNTPINCASNLDCGTSGFTGQEFCSLDDVYKNFQNATCNNPGTTSSYCDLTATSKKIVDCPLTCSNGQCIICSTNAQCNDNNSTTNDLCNNPSTPQSYCSNIPIPPACGNGIREGTEQCDDGNLNNLDGCSSICHTESIVCSTNSQCGTNTNSSNFCSNNNIAKNQTLFTCNNPGTYSSFCSQSTSQIQTQQCQYGCSNNQCNQPQINCSLNSQCGQDGFIGNNYCSANNVVKDYKSYTCNNPGTPQSYCSSSISQITSQQCTQNQQCSNGQCSNIVCSNNAQCGTTFSSQNFCFNSAVAYNTTYYTCNNPGTINSFCSFITNKTTSQQCQYGCSNNQCNQPPIACSSNSDCGSTINSNNFCFNNNVAKNVTSFICNLPGTPSSFCSSNTTKQTVQQCSQSCFNGQCQTINCTTNTQCNDNNPLTLDSCINPGTQASHCSNTPINCFSNVDCGSSGFTGQEFCSLNDVYKNFQNATCINPGTTLSYCTLQVTQNLINQCQYSCSQGACIRCNTNPQCSDGNSSTQDICNFPGTIQSYCSNPPIACSNNAQCGTDGFIGNNYCSSNSIARDYKSYTCNNPGTPQAFCSSSTNTTIINQCLQNQQCSNGQCSNIVCSNNAQCGTTINSNNFCSNNNVAHNITSFVCNNPGLVTSFCSNSTSQITSQQCQYGCSNAQCNSPQCGNHILEGSEQCDDGNLNNLDGCSSQCTTETCMQQCTANIDLLLDRSGSMGQSFLGSTKIKIVQNSTKLFVNNVLSNTTNDNVLLGLSTISTAYKNELDFTSNIASLNNKVNSLIASGNTNYNQSIRGSVSKLISGRSVPRYIILLSDGKPTISKSGDISTGGTTDPIDIKSSIDAAIYASANNIPIYTIGFGAGSQINEGLLQNISSLTGGNYHLATTPGALDSVYNTISSEICSCQF